MKPYLRYILLAAAISLGAAFLWIFIAPLFARGQSDFAVYYYATKAWAEGLNPYDNKNLALISGHPIVLTYGYIPALLPLFRLFSTLPFSVDVKLFFLIKAFLLCFMIWLWMTRVIPVREDGLFFILFVLFAWRSGALVDLYTGNKSILEETLLWSAFYAFLTKRYTIFSGLLALAALFNFTPIVFLILLTAVKYPNKIRDGVLAILFFFVIVLVPFAWHHEYFSLFISNSSENLREYGRFNVGVFAFVEDIVYHSYHQWSLAPAVVSKCIYYVFAAAILAIAIRPWRRLASLDDKRPLLFFTLVTYMLVMPRVKDYTLILLIPSAYYFIQELSKRNRLAGFGLIVLTILPVSDSWFGYSAHIIPLAYYPLWIVILYWILYYRAIMNVRGANLSALETAPQLPVLNPEPM